MFYFFCFLFVIYTILFECYNFYRLQVLLGVIFRNLSYVINSFLEQRREYSVLLKAVKQCQQIKNTMYIFKNLEDGVFKIILVIYRQVLKYQWSCAIICVRIRLIVSFLPHKMVPWFQFIKKSGCRQADKFNDWRIKTYSWKINR